MARVVGFVSPTVRQRRAAKAAEVRDAGQLVLPLLDQSQQLDIARAIERAAAALESSDFPWGRFIMLQRDIFQDLFDAADRTDRPVAALKAALVSAAHLSRNSTMVALSRTEMAKLCKVTPQDISSVMVELARQGVVGVERVGRQVVYHLNPELSWAGTEEARIVATIEFRQRFPRVRLAMVEAT